MNRLAKSLLVGLLEQENYITAFYGGGFKPPTKGHFAVVKKSLEQFPDIDKFYIIIGSGIRDGISQDESYSVWNIYKKYLGDKVEIVKADSSPLKYVKDYIKENTDHKSLVFIGSRDGNDEDLQDFVKRKEFFDKYGDHVEVKNITTSGGVSGTKAREAAKVSKEQFFQFLPKELTDEERNLIFEYVQTVIQENAIKKVTNKAKELGANFSKAFKDQKGDFKGFGPLVIKYLDKKQKLTPEEKNKLKQNFTDILKTSGIAITFPVLGASGSVLLGWLTNKLTKGKFTTLPSKFKDQLLEQQILETLSGVNLTQPLNESFYLDIPKFNQPKTIQQHLIENISEISLSKENAVNINGDLIGGAFTVGDITYEYSIKNIPNPYKDLGLFYNIQFTPRGEVTSIPKGGKENYIKILSTMYKIIVDFIEKEQPDYIGISSLDNSGDKNYHTVYNRLTTNNLNLIPGYFRKDSSLQFDSPQGKGRFIVLKRKESLNENATYSSNIDYKQKIVDLTNYMRKKGYKIDPLPKVIFNNGDKENAKNFFGKTAYYDPNTMIIYLYTEGRHPKDIVRSFSHEMIHHIQNLEDRLTGLGANTDVNQDDHLDQIEREAYETGNIMFRSWADSITGNKLEENLNNPNLTNQLKNYIEDYTDININLLKDLLKIKSKYPKQLDPRVGGNKFGYRGTTFDKDFINKLKIKSKSNGVTEYEVPTNLKINSRGKRGFLSFSTDEEVAKGFGHYSGYVDYKKSPNRVGGYVKISLDNPNFIIHPNYMGELSKDMEYSKDNEKETLYVGNSFTPESIFVVDKDIYDTLTEGKKKDPFGLNAYAMELGRLREDEDMKVSPFSKDIEEYILSDIKEYGDILEFKIDLEDVSQYSSDSNLWEFYDDINNVKVIVKLKPTIKNISEFKFYSLQDDNQLSFNKLKHYNPKVMNTIFKIFMDEVLPNNPKILIQPFDYLRYRLFRAMLNNNLDGNQYKIDTKDDPMGQSILLVQKLNEAKKPYKHKHGFDDKLGKDPFGLNQYARELAQSLEEVLFIAGKEVEKIENPTNNPEDAIVIYKDGTSEPYLDTIKEGRKKKKDPKKGTGKKPKGSGRRLYTDEDPKDTVGVSFRTKEDIVDTLHKKSFKAKSHARQSQIINLIHQRVRAAYQNAKDPDTKSRLKRGLDYIEKRKEASKEKTKRLKNITENIQNPDVKFKRPKLKYSYTSLQPYIDKETMEEHFDKHFKGYTDKLNTELDEKKIRVEAEDQIQAIQKILGKYSKNNIIKNNGGGFYNHVLYFENITPDYKSPSSKFRKMLEENFNSFSEFKDKFKEAGLKQFGSGWVFLIKKGNKLVIESYANQDNPYLDKDFKGEILIAMDVWEHAYYLKHKSQRGKYIDDFFRVIDYKVAEERLKEEKTLSENGQKIAKKNMNDYKKSNNPSGKVKDPFGLNQYARELAQGLEEAIVGDKIECDNCGWSWDIEDGGDDLYTCHKCWHDNTPKQLNEGRYDTLANKLSSTAFRVFKDTHDRGDKEGSFKFRIDHPKEEHDIPSKDFFFDFEGTVEITDSEYKVDGGANAGFDEDGDETTPLLSVTFKIPKNPTKNPSWEDISFDIKDVVRHELEHLTQDGENLKSGKYMKDDQLIRDLIDADLLSKSQYFKLEKEVDAMLQGLYFKAKKSKQPFKDIINNYLNIFISQEKITPEEKEEILDLWRRRRKALSLPIFENEKKVMDYKIFLDMDGVLVNFDEQFKELTGEYPKQYEQTHTPDEFWEAIDSAGVGFWRGMKWMPGGEALYNRAAKHDHVLLSSPSRSEVSKIGKRLWRRDKTPNTKLILSRSHLKKNYAAPNHILIDDRESNIKQWRDAGGIGILYKSAEQVNKELDKLSL